MAIVTLDEMKAHVNVTQATDDLLLQHQIDAAQDHIEGTLGYSIADKYDPAPPALKQAVLMLAAHWYANREATLVGIVGQTVPFGVRDITDRFRHWWGHDPDAA